jgi:Helix-turn-helix domain of resolvase
MVEANYSLQQRGLRATVALRLGIKFGRKPKLAKHQRDEARARLAQGETLTAIARSYNVSHMIICRLQI